jgi:hypothetical protein
MWPVCSAAERAVNLMLMAGVVADIGAVLNIHSSDFVGRFYRVTVL